MLRCFGATCENSVHANTGYQMSSTPGVLDLQHAHHLPRHAVGLDRSAMSIKEGYRQPPRSSWNRHRARHARDAGGAAITRWHNELHAHKLIRFVRTVCSSLASLATATTSFEGRLTANRADTVMFVQGRQVHWHKHTYRVSRVASCGQIGNRRCNHMCYFARTCGLQRTHSG